MRKRQPKTPTVFRGPKFEPCAECSGGFVMKTGGWVPYAVRCRCWFAYLATLPIDQRAAAVRTQGSK